MLNEVIKNNNYQISRCCRSSAFPVILESSGRAGRDPSLPSVHAHQREEDQHPEPAAAEHAGGPAAALRFVPGKHGHARTHTHKGSPLPPEQLHVVGDVNQMDRHGATCFVFDLTSEADEPIKGSTPNIYWTLLA